jgi:hypothetical protein
MTDVKNYCTPVSTVQTARFHFKFDFSYLAVEYGPFPNKVPQKAPCPDGGEWPRRESRETGHHRSSLASTLSVALNLPVLVDDADHSFRRSSRSFSHTTSHAPPSIFDARRRSSGSFHDICGSFHSLGYLSTTPCGTRRQGSLANA